VAEFRRAIEWKNMSEQLQPATLSVILPTLNEASVLGATLESVARLNGPVEVIVVDGGSQDQTIGIARAHQVRVYTAPRGRGSQMDAGAGLAHGKVLWFVHADTKPPPDAVEQILRACDQPDIVGGSFTVQFDGPTYAARFLSGLYRCLGRLRLCYGDSAIFVRRDAYKRIGGFRPLLLFEDVDLVHRLKRRGRFVRLPGVVVTSSRRFERGSIVLTLARWSLLQILYWMGVKPHLLARLYRPIR
jgi:rSAM/selenodomain-associated transferase 2